MAPLIAGLDLRMTMVDIARLARVRRPVVTVWRRRPAPLPFPGPVAGLGGEERFDADEVVDWLERTGRGNNPDARADAAAHAWPAGLPARDDAAVFNGVSALLCLKEMSGQRLASLGDADLLDLADEADPDDELLMSEIEALGERRVPLARFADSLADAAFSTAGAIELMMGERFRFAVGGHAAVALAPAAGDLVTSLAVSLATEAGIQHGALVDPTRGGSDLLLGLVRREDIFADATMLVAAHGRPESRQARRRLRARGVHCAPLAVAEDGSWSVPGPALHVARYPSPGVPDMTDAEMLNAVENIVLQMDDTHRAIVLAPAEVLTDRLTDVRAEGLRDDLLRQGRVRAIARLPKGLVPSRSRQALGLWVLGPAYPEIPAADRWTMVADLTNTRLDPAATGDLVADLAVAMGGRESVRAHAFRFARPVLTRNLVAGRELVVGSQAPPRLAREAAASLAVRFDELSAVVSAPDIPVEVADLRVEVREADPNAAAPVPATLGEQVAEGHVRLVAGNRLDIADLPAGSVPVIGVEELTGANALGERGIDRWRFSGDYPAGRYTEPGDVVFSTTPRPAALVDVEGMSVVVWPARVLRVSRAARHGLVPWLLADDINTLAHNARAWRLWRVRQVPPDEREVVAEAMAIIERRRDQTRQRLARLDELKNVILRGVSTGTLLMKINREGS